MEPENPRPRMREEMQKDLDERINKGIEEIAKEKDVPVILVKINIFDVLFGRRNRK